MLGAGSGPAPGLADPGGLERLRVTRAALMEAMRLYPPAYAVDRTATSPLRLAGHDIPPGSVLAVSPWSTHRHPEFWPDPERFDPGRFLGAQERPRYAYFPFGGGPRSCVGEHFAVLEATILLAALLRRYTVSSRSRHADRPSPRHAPPGRHRPRDPHPPLPPLPPRRTRGRSLCSRLGEVPALAGPVRRRSGTQWVGAGGSAPPWACARPARV